MKGSDQGQLRRQHIFSILDDLKEKGERINADKVARIGKMGKQTILPYYNEWRFLGTLGEEQELELPEDLVRGLKRGIAKWKYELSEEKRTCEEAANQEIDELKESLSQLLGRNDQLTRNNTGLQNENEQLASEIETIKLEFESKKQDFKELESLLKSEQKQNEHLHAMAEEQKTLHLQTISALEKQMDHRNQEQLNHWLSVVDDERRLKQGLEKKISKLNEEQQDLKKANLELQSRLDSKSKAYIQACEERNTLSSGREKVEAIAQLTNQLMVLLDCDQNDLLGAVRNLQTESRELFMLQQHYNAMKATNEKLENSLSETEERIKQIGAMELELERVRGAAEAFEKALPKRTEIEGMKQ